MKAVSLSLIISRHPVISSFLRRKWGKIYNEVRQNFRSSAIFTVTATRAILAAFDIDQRSSIHNGVEENITETNYCHYKTNWLWSPKGRVKMDWTWGWEEPGIGFWITAAQCAWLLILALR